MKKLIWIFLTVFLAACSKDKGQEKTIENKKEIAEIKDKNDQKIDIYALLDGISLKDNYSSQYFTRIDFEDSGNFVGDYFSNPSLDDFESEDNEKIKNKYGKDEDHKSVFSGSFKVIKTIKKGIYQVELSDFKITNTSGSDGQMEYLYWVDFAKGLDPADRYILFLPSSPISTKVIENSQYKEALASGDLEKNAHGDHDHSHHDGQESDHIHEENHDHEDNHRDHDDDHDHEDDNEDHDHHDHGDISVFANGFVLYNIDKKIIFSEHDKWAETRHNH